MASCYDKVVEFKNKYPKTICWRIKQHCKIIESNLNPDEEIIYAFAAQFNQTHDSIFDTAVMALTTNRLLIAQNRIISGYSLSSVTPDLYNDMQVNSGFIWGKVTIDTMKETIVITNIDKKALSEIQVNISKFMIEAKKKFYSKQ